MAALALGCSERGDDEARVRLHLASTCALAIRGRTGSAAAPAAKCRNCLLWGNFTLAMAAPLPSGAAVRLAASHKGGEGHSGFHTIPPSLPPTGGLLIC